MTSVAKIIATKLIVAGALATALTVGGTVARAQDSTLLGAGAGAGGGAGIGFALGGPVGAVVGGLVGAGVGAGAGHAIGKDDKGRPVRSGGYAPSGQGDVTAAVQGELNAAGYDAGPPDGRMGPRTQNAIRAYQANNGLPQDGYPSTALLDHLRQKRAAASGQVAPAAFAPPPPPPPVGATPAASPSVPSLPGAQAPSAQAPNCRPFESRMTVDGKETVTTGTACLQSDGTWRPIN
jgi:hypothetical protein